MLAAAAHRNELARGGGSRLGARLLLDRRVPLTPLDHPHQVPDGDPAERHRGYWDNRHRSQASGFKISGPRYRSPNSKRASRTLNRSTNRSNRSS